MKNLYFLLIFSGCSFFTALDADRELSTAIQDYKEAVIEEVKTKKQKAINDLKRPVIEGRKKIIKKLKKETKKLNCKKVLTLSGAKEVCDD